MTTIYYAHCKSIYGTKQEERDVYLLVELGYEVINPNEEVHQNMCRACTNPMDYFLNLVGTCSVLAFRALPYGKIPAGVLKEIKHARELEILVIELPVHEDLRSMTVDETRAYLTEVGER